MNDAVKEGVDLGSSMDLVGWVSRINFSMLALDLGVFNKHQHEVGVRESLIWTGVWVSLALLFNFGVYKYMGEVHAYEFLTCFVLEKSLSVDNIFVMTVIFSYFKVDSRYQHRVLFWGIMGALVMRILFIVGGVSLIEHFHFLLYFFGAFLVYTGIKLLFSEGEQMDPRRIGSIKCLKIFQMTPHFHGKSFFKNRWRLAHDSTLFGFAHY